MVMKALKYLSWSGILAGVALACTMPANYLYPIRQGNLTGFINRDGKVVVTPKYKTVGEFSEGRVGFYENRKFGYLDHTGKVVIEAKYESGEEFAEGRAVVRDEQGYLVLDADGRVVNRIPYRTMGRYHAGLMPVQRPRSEGKPTAYGYVNRDGKVVIEPLFTGAGEFPDDPRNLAIGSLNHDWCYFDRTGKIIIRIPMGPNLDRSRPFKDGRLAMKEGFNFGYKDATGNWAIPPKYNEASDFDNGLANVQDGTKWITIDTKGIEVARRKGPQPLGPAIDGLTKVTENGLLGWMDAKGELAFPMRRYDEAFDYSCGLVRIKLDGRFGYMDQKGQLKIPNQYEMASDFKEGLASVYFERSFGYINTNGSIVWKAEPPPPLQLRPLTGPKPPQ